MALGLLLVDDIDVLVLGDDVALVMDESPSWDVKIITKGIADKNRLQIVAEGMDLGGVVQQKDNDLEVRGEGGSELGLELLVVGTKKTDVRVVGKVDLEAREELIELISAVVAGNEDGDAMIHTATEALVHGACLAHLGGSVDHAIGNGGGFEEEGDPLCDGTDDRGHGMVEGGCTRSSFGGDCFFSCVSWLKITL